MITREMAYLRVTFFVIMVLFGLSVSAESWQDRSPLRSEFILLNTRQTQDLVSLVHSNETWYMGYRTSAEANYVTHVMRGFEKEEIAPAHRCNDEGLALALAIQIKYKDTVHIMAEIEKRCSPEQIQALISSFPHKRNTDFLAIQQTSDNFRTTPNYFNFKFARKDITADQAWDFVLEQNRVFTDLKMAPSKYPVEALRDLLRLNIKLDALWDERLEKAMARYLTAIANNKDTWVNAYQLLSPYDIDGHMRSLSDAKMARYIELLKAKGLTPNSPISLRNVWTCENKEMKTTPYLSTIGDFLQSRVRTNLERVYGVNNLKTAPFGTKGMTAYLRALKEGDSSLQQEMAKRDSTLPDDGCAKLVSTTLWERRASGGLSIKPLEVLRLIPSAEWTEDNDLLGYFIQHVMEQTMTPKGKGLMEQLKPYPAKVISKNMNRFFGLWCNATVLPQMTEAVRLGFTIDLQGPQLSKCLDNVFSKAGGTTRQDRAEFLLALTEKKIAPLFRMKLAKAGSDVEYLSHIAGAESSRALTGARRSVEQGRIVRGPQPPSRASRRVSEPVLVFKIANIPLRVDNRQISDDEFKMLEAFEENRPEALEIAVRALIQVHAAQAKVDQRQVQSLFERLQSLAKVAEIKDIKPAWEKMFTSGNESLLYNLSAVNLFTVANEKRMQCSTGTLLNMLPLALNSQLQGRETPVAIFTSGHVLPGTIRAERGAYVLRGIETTVLEGAEKDYTLNPPPYNVVELREYLITQILGNRLLNAQEYADLTLKAMTAKYGFKMVGPGRAGSALNASPFGFGVPETKPGDQIRGGVSPTAPKPAEYTARQGEEHGLRFFEAVSPGQRLLRSMQQQADLIEPEMAQILNLIPMETVLPTVTTRDFDVGSDGMLIVAPRLWVGCAAQDGQIRPSQKMEGDQANLTRPYSVTIHGQKRSIYGVIHLQGWGGINCVIMSMPK